MITRKEHFRIILDCESRVDIHNDSNHIPILMNTQTKMKLRKGQIKEEKTSKYWKPDEQRKIPYDRAIFEKLMGNRRGGR